MADFHYILQIVMGWDDDQLHQFCHLWITLPPPVFSCLVVAEGKLGELGKKK
jgi:hypothetical protein